MPETDHNQALRIKRFATGAVSYLMWLGLVGYFRFMGMATISWETLLLCCGLATLHQGALFGVFRSGLNKRFKDPSLTFFQMLMGTIWAMVGVYYSGEARGGMLILYLVVFVYGLFGLKVRQFLFLSVFAITSYSGVLFILHRQEPAGFNIKLELMNLVILVAVLPWFSLVGGYITSLREKVARAMAIIETLATHDDLTQVFNRRQMFQILEREKALGDRGVSPFSICIFDLDHFKAVNDTYGHRRGDIVLRTVAQTIQKNLRDIDHIARYGGEEFILILTNSGVSEAMRCAERVRSLAEVLTFEGLPDDFGVTISVGVTTYTPSEDIGSCINRADKALYRAKARGRNRVEYEPATTQVANAPAPRSSGQATSTLT